jgi:hypothetical protein
MDWSSNTRSTSGFYNQGYVSKQVSSRSIWIFTLPVLPTLRTRLSQKSKSNGTTTQNPMQFCLLTISRIGAPTLIFVTGAALRVADVTRVLKDKRLRGEKGGEVAKLFAKHFKLEEHVTYLKRTKVGAAVGTPGRIGKLLCETGEFEWFGLSPDIDSSFETRFLFRRLRISCSM